MLSNCVYGACSQICSDDKIWCKEDMKVIMEKVNACVVEYDLKVNEKKSNLVCINGKVGRRRWMMGDWCIREVEAYKYL